MPIAGPPRPAEGGATAEEVATELIGWAAALILVTALIGQRVYRRNERGKSGAGYAAQEGYHGRS